MRPIHISVWSFSFRAYVVCVPCSLCCLVLMAETACPVPSSVYLSWLRLHALNPPVCIPHGWDCMPCSFQCVFLMAEIACPVPSSVYLSWLRLHALNPPVCIPHGWDCMPCSFQCVFVMAETACPVHRVVWSSGHGFGVPLPLVPWVRVQLRCHVLVWQYFKGSGALAPSPVNPWPLSVSPDLVQPVANGTASKWLTHIGWLSVEKKT